LTIEEQALQVGDRVKLILDKERSTDNHLHGRKGYIINIQLDDASSATGNPKDNYLYTIQLDNREIPDIHFRRHDIQLVNEG
jgi:hypothetical protein